MSAVRTPDAECLARTLQALAAERPDEGLAAILAALRESFAAPGAAVLRVEGSRLVPAASDGLKVGPRALKGGTGAPRNGGYPLVVAGQLEGMLLLAGVSQETLRREAGRVQPWLDLAAVALRNARLTAERERARSDAERRVRTFRALHELGLAIAGVLDPAALARLATDRARDLLPIDQAHVYLWDPTDGRLQHLDGNGPRPAARTIQPGEGATGLAFTRREAVVVENYQRWPSALRHVKARGVRVAAAVPLLVDDRAIGALVAASSRHHRFETTDLRRLSLLAAQVAPALEAARLHVESERRRAEAEALAELARRGAAERDPDEVMRLVTRQACRLLGADYGAVALREPEGRAGWHGVSGNRTDAWRTASFDRGPGLVARALADGRPFILERIGDDPSLPLSHFPIHAAEGGRTALGVPLSSNDQPLGVLLLGWRSDVTVSPEQIRLAEALASYAATVLDRARAHAAAAERAAERTAVIEQMPNGVVVFDRSGRVVLMNDAASRILGVPPGSPLMGVANAPSAFELRDSASGARLQPEQLPSARALAGEVIRHYELLLRRPGETEDRWLEESAEPLWGSDGAVIGALMVISDVTEQRRLIRDLARSEARFRTLCEAVTCGVLVRDSDGQIVDANEAAEQILGLSLEELRGQRWSAALQAAAGEDATSLPEAERPAAIALRTGQPVRNYTLAVRRPDGQRRWLQVDAVPAFAPDGAIAQVVTSFIDVTARTEAEAALRARVRQQAAIARLGQQALAGGDLAALMDETALLVAEALGVPYATLWELVPDGSTLVLRAGVGWGADVGPGTRRTAGPDVPAGYTAATGEAVIFEDLRTDARFMRPPVLEAHGVVSGMTVLVQGRSRPFGVLGVYATAPRSFAEDDAHFLQAAANVLAATVSRADAEAEQRRLVAILEATPDFVSTTDVEGRLSYLNRAGRRLLGVRPDEDLSSRRVTEGHPAWARAIVEDEGLPTAERDGAWEGEIAVLDHQGREIPVSQVIIAHRGVDGAVAYYSTIGRDISERKEAERQREAVARSEKLRALGQMAGGVAHDLNQYLGLVVGHSDLAQRAIDAPTPDVASVRASLRIIGQAALDGAETVKRLLAFARSRPEGPSGAVDLGELLREVATLTAPRWRDLAQSEGRPISLELEAHHGLLIEGWAGSLREAFMNLVLNAVDAMPRGGTLRLAAGRQGDRVQATIADTGSGMTAEVRARIFEPFFTTKGERGTGLGLAMVFGVVEQHQGVISVESAPGRGTTFHISFPAAPQPAASHPLPAAAPPVRPLRILAVDDEPSLGEMVRLMLASDRHRVVVAHSGEEALERMAVEPFDLVISDVAMGAGMNGWDLASQVRQRYPDVGFVLATGWGAQIDPDEARARGVDQVVAKPYRMADLRGIVTRHQAAARARPGWSEPGRPATEPIGSPGGRLHSSGR